MAITFRRILHPIGQGAFFTEQFFHEDSENSIFNVVYDCGSFTTSKKKAPLILQNEIDDVFHNKEHIDFLFISHFDGDHTNGLEHLLNATTMDENTYVFIPFHHPYLILAMEEDYPVFSRFIEQAVSRDVRFISVNACESLDFWERIEPVNIEKLSNQIQIREKLIKISSDSIDPIWYYLPFMSPGVNEFENEFLKEAFRIDGLCLDDVNSIIEHKDQLKQVYKTIGKPKGKNTRINTNSLFLLSLPAKNNVRKCHFWVDGRFYVDGCWGYRNHFNLTASCLFTGDSNLKCNDYMKVVSCSSNILNRYSDTNNIGIMQIPHHGSVYCYPEDISKDNIVSSAFVNFEPYYSQRIFYSDILRRFSNNKPLFLITNGYSTRLEIYVDI